MPNILYLPIYLVAPLDVITYGEGSVEPLIGPMLSQAFIQQIAVRLIGSL